MLNVICQLVPLSITWTMNAHSVPVFHVQYLGEIFIAYTVIYCIIFHLDVFILLVYFPL